MDNNRDCFTFFESFYKSIQYFRDKDRLRLYEAIIEYGLFGVRPEFDLTKEKERHLYAVFEGTVKTIDSSNKRREAGRRGGLVGNGGAPVGNHNAVKCSAISENNSKTTANQKQINTDIEEEVEVEVDIDREEEKDGAEKLEEKGVQGERGEEKPPFMFSPRVLDFPAPAVPVEEVTVTDDKKAHSLAYVKTIWGMN